MSLFKEAESASKPEVDEDIPPPDASPRYTLFSFSLASHVFVRDFHIGCRIHEEIQKHLHPCRADLRSNSSTSLSFFSILPCFSSLSFLHHHRPFSFFSIFLFSLFSLNFPSLYVFLFSKLTFIPHYHLLFLPLLIPFLGK